MSIRRSGSLHRVMLPLLFLFFATAAMANNFLVDTDGSAIDFDTADGICGIAMGGGGCTLKAAIQQGNALPGPHTITFKNTITKVTFDHSLVPIMKPMTIDGTSAAPGGRVELDGVNAFSGIDIADTAGGNLPGSGTTIENLVIGGMLGNGVSMVGGGHSVINCYIGTDVTGMVIHKNSGNGISITTPAAGPFGFPPDFTGVGVNLIGGISALGGNVISGNDQDGIAIFAERTVLTTVSYNRIGTNVLGSAAIPNGLNGVSITGNAFANTIGPGNVISGNTNVNSDGVHISGMVLAPNNVVGNIIGPSADLLTNLGNGHDGIYVDSTKGNLMLPDVAEIGAANIIGMNGENGIEITGSGDKVRVFGNFIGVGQDPILMGAFLDIGNVKDGLRITTSGHQIGGSTTAEGNIISANNMSGIDITGSGVVNVTIQGNVIGRDPSKTILFGNTLDGITLTNTGSNLIGGTASGEGNLIASNGRNGVKVTNSGNGWANLITHNSIFANHTIEQGMGIDLDQAAQDVDSTDNSTPGMDPNILYANFGQNAAVIDSVTNPPHYDPATGNTVVTWALQTSASTPVTLEFFGNDSPGFSNHGEGQIYLGSATATTDGSGNASATTLVTPGSAYDSRTKYITMTVTPTNTIPVPASMPTTGPANNTSEFSNAVQVANPGSLQFSAATYSGSESGGSVTITVTRTGGSDGAVSIDYATSDGSATQPADYTAASGTLNWSAGESSSKTFPVTIQPDPIFEGNETVNLTLSNVTGFATAGSPSTATLTINDDDAQPSISIDDVTHLEGDSGTTTYTFTATLSNPSASTVSVNYTTGNGTATTANADFVTASGTVTFNPGVTTQPITVLVNGDTNLETDETFVVNLSVPVNATISDGQGTGTIQNDDSPTPTFTISDVTHNEGNAGTTSYTFTVTLTPASASATSVQATTADGTATVSDNDFASTTQTLNFPIGSTTQNFTVLVNGDMKFEANEAFTVNLSANSVGTAVSGFGTGNITNDDTQPSLSVDDVSHLEGNAGTTGYIFTVSLSNPSSQTVTVNWSTADGTATTANSDYTAASGTATFTSGVTTQQFTVNANGDATNEPNETFNVNLTAPSNATIADAQGVGTILNDDSTTPTFTIDNVTHSEGNAGTTSYVFTVTLSPVSASATSVQAATADGSATVADSDYVAKTQTLNFGIGVSTQTFTVVINGDPKFETSETFAVNLSANSGGTAISGTGGTGTIQNDDSQPAVAINDVSHIEGNAGITAYTFAVTLSNPSSQTVAVNYATADGTATTANSDYAAASGTVTFNPAVVSQSVTVNVNGDGTNEPDEIFAVNLTSPSNGSIADAQGIGTIQNDDSTTPTFTIDSVSHLEGNAGPTSYVFTVTLAPASASAVTVQAATADGTATTGDSDYTAKTQVLSFPIGTTTQTFTALVNGDAKFETDESFAVNLSANSGGTAVSGSGSGTIQNDDSQPTISIDDVSHNEGNAGTTAYAFTVSLSNPSFQPVQVTASSADNTATVANSDYTANSALVSIPAGSTTAPFTVNANGDATVEPTETFFVNLSVPSNATIADGQGLGTIVDDDNPTPTFSVSDVSHGEGNGGSTAFVFTVTLSPTSGTSKSVQAQTVNGSATTANSDYAAKTQVLTFGPGVSTQTFSVTVNPDINFETDETFGVTLSGNSSGTAIGASGTGTILNDDNAPTISIGDVSHVEGNAGTTLFTFQVTLSAESFQTITVDYATANGTASGSSYNSTSGTLTFPPGVTTQTVVVQVLGNNTSGPNTTFFVNLSNSANAVIADAQGTGTIVNDDPVGGANAQDIPALGVTELALLAMLLAAAGMIAIRRT